MDEVVEDGGEHDLDVAEVLSVIQEEDIHLLLSYSLSSLEGHDLEDGVNDLLTRADLSQSSPRENHHYRSQFNIGYWQRKFLIWN